MTFTAGAAQADITPQKSTRLSGFAHAERISEGVHDPLLSSALSLHDGRTGLLFSANDVLFIGKDLAERARARISAETGLDPGCILISATHTHSGPATIAYLAGDDDPAAPRPDPDYLGLLEDSIVRAALRAHRETRPAEVGLALADASGVGGNRRNPRGPADPQVPILLARGVDDSRPIGCLLVCAVHPTVLHQDSKLVSADFPGASRRYLQETVLNGCPVLTHTGAAGDQSPRHTARANTFAEAQRLGELLGQQVEEALRGVQYRRDLSLGASAGLLENLPRRSIPSLAEAQQALTRAYARLETMRACGASPGELRTAQVDIFGAEAGLVLARADQDGRLEAACKRALPAAVQVLRVGPWMFIGWPGEIFVEYALEVRARNPKAFVITLANGELQGYIATPAAAQEGAYEAASAVFAPESGRILVETTLRLIEETAGPSLV